MAALTVATGPQSSNDMAMLEAYLSACKAAGDRPREDVAGALGDTNGEGVFRLSSMELVRAQRTCD